MSCELAFLSKPCAYQDDDKKVIYTVSYLTNVAQLWYEPYLLNPAFPPLRFTQNWEAFKAELRLNFGKTNEEANAEHALKRLRMADNQKIARYVVDFNNLSVQTQWNNRALSSTFYKGLPDRLKDQIMDRAGGHPSRLNGLRRLAQELDNIYWQ